MLVPIFWLKEFVKINLPLKELMWRLTEIGLTCEKVERINGEDVLDIEVTANRPDWMSIIGVAGEIAALQNLKVKETPIQKLPLPKKKLPIKLNTDFKLFERWTAVAITNISVKPSSSWIQKKIKAVNLRPINNIVDITNLIMTERGMPMHAFDYDQIKGHEMTVTCAKGGEEFTSVDEISYQLPQGAMIIKDQERIIDLAGIKGGFNSGIKNQTKNILLHLTINNPVIIRKTSQALGLRSDASAIYERGPDKGGTVAALQRAVDLILKESGGEVASELIDIYPKKIKPWKLNLNFTKLNQVLGVIIPKTKVIKILQNLDLNPKLKGETVICTIPTRRGDLKIEEDLIEEVARIYGYNNLPLTLPKGEIKQEKIAFSAEETIIQKAEELLIAAGYTQVMTYSLISEKLIKNCLLEIKNHLAVKNPVSNDFRYLRHSLLPGLIQAVKINPETEVKLFEIDKTFPEEKYQITAIAKGIEFREFKGVIDLILERLKIKEPEIVFETKSSVWHPSHSATIKIGQTEIGNFGEINPEVKANFQISDNLFAFEMDAKKTKANCQEIKYQPIGGFPPQIEDLTFVFPPKTRIGEVLKTIHKTNDLISEVILKEIFQDNYTFRLSYQSHRKTLTDQEVKKIRETVVQKIKDTYGGRLK